MCSDKSDKGVYRILSIDGGGIRGIIPAMVLAEIEEKTGKQIHQLFNLIAGTSTGAILALGLTKPNPEHPKQAQYSAKALAQLYVEQGEQIFPKPLFKSLQTAMHFLDEKYSDRGLNKVLKQYFGDARFGDALVETLITAYEIESQAAIFLNSSEAKTECPNYLMRHILRAATAAPTFFEPKKLPINPADEGAEKLSKLSANNYLAMIDGGIFANNPAMCAYVEGIKHAPRGAEIMVVSLGCGAVLKPIPYSKAKNWGLAEWAQPILRVVWDGVGDTVDYQLRKVLRQQGQSGPHYYRFQSDLGFVDPQGSMRIASEFLDDARKENLDDLQSAAQTLINARQQELVQLCACL